MNIWWLEQGGRRSMVIKNNCDGSGPHSHSGKIKIFPISNGNLILCNRCWRRENRYRKFMAELSNCPEKWTTNNWDLAEEY